MGPCHRIPNGIICVSNRKLYRYTSPETKKEWFFSIEENNGPWPLKKDGELCVNAGKAFWRMYQYFVEEDDISKFQVMKGEH